MKMLARSTSLTEATALLVVSCCGALRAFHRVIPGAASRFAQVAACSAAVIWAVAVASSWAAPHWLTGWRCVARMAIVGALPTVLGIVMLRRAGSAAARSYRLVLVPAGALAMVATQLVCAKDGVDHVLVWHAGPLAVGFAVGMLFA